MGFPNLEAEIARHKLKHKDLALLLHVTPSALTKKLKRGNILGGEMVIIRNFLPKKFSLDYLFAEEPVYSYLYAS